MKHPKISCQYYKIDNLLLSSRCRLNYMKMCSCLHAHYTETLKNSWEVCEKKAYGEKHSFIDLTYVVGAHWNCLRQFHCVPTTHVTEIIQGNLFWNTYLSRIMFISFASLKHLNLQISIKILVTIWQIVYIYVTAISLNLFSELFFAKLVLAWL